MWCMTLKCRTEVPGERSRTVVRFSYQHDTASSSTSRTKLRPRSDLLPGGCFSPGLPIAFSCRRRPVAINQRRHPKVDLAFDIEMPALIANRHFLPFDFPREFIRAMHPQALVSTSFPPRDLKYPFGLLVNRHSCFFFQSMVSIVCCSTKRSSAFKSNRARPTLRQGNSRLLALR
jgi:hypothetical protein